MASYNEIGTATDHNDLLDKIRIFVSTTIPVAERHTVLRNATEANPLGDFAAEKTVLLLAPGLAGTDQIFYGMKIYKSVSLDVYNMQIDGFTGYVPGNLFEAQPGSIYGTGASGIGITLWNQAIPYWLVANGQGFICCAKIQNSYVMFGAGFLLKYATFGQYPYPLLVFGNLPTAAMTRYSDTNWVSGWKGGRGNFRLRFVSGTWLAPQCLPYVKTTINRNTNNDSNVAAGYYGLYPLELSDSTNLYGPAQQLFYIPGFNNTVENTLVVGGVTYVVFRDGTKTGNQDYIALKLT